MARGGDRRRGRRKGQRKKNNSKTVGNGPPRTDGNDSDEMDNTDAFGHGVLYFAFLHIVNYINKIILTLGRVLCTHRFRLTRACAKT